MLKDKRIRGMNVTIKLSDENAAALKAQADAQGLTVERWLEQIAELYVHPASIAHLITRKRSS